MPMRRRQRGGTALNLTRPHETRETALRPCGVNGLPEEGSMTDGNEQYAAERGNGFPAGERSVVGSAVSRALAELNSILSGVELDRERLLGMRGSLMETLHGFC